MILALALHILAALVWVGGMFFAHQILRPSAAPLEPAMRLPLWERVFGRFLPLVLASILILLATGYAMVFLAFGGFAGLPLWVNLMQAIGLAMVLIFLHLYFAPWPRFRRAVAAGDLAGAGRQLDQIRRLVTVNLLLGLAVVVVAATGRYW
ncbi:MAG: CopD family protein [Alphaproteobacteria bacterium]|nr:CopD family protein [Alphaproteobacteria bacterium]